MRKQRSVTTVLETMLEILQWIKANPSAIFNVSEFEINELEFDDDNEVGLNELDDVSIEFNEEIEFDEDDDYAKTFQSEVLNSLKQFPELELVKLYVEAILVHCVINKANTLALNHVVNVTYRARPDVPVK